MTLELTFEQLEFMASMMDQEIAVLERFCKPEMANDCIALAEFSTGKNIPCLENDQERDAMLFNLRTSLIALRSIRGQIKDQIGI